MGGDDRAAAALLFLIRGLPADRADWGQAMRGDLDEVQGSQARWRFTLGCVKAVAGIRARESLGGSHRDGVLVRAVVLSAVTGALALGVYGLIRYPLLGAEDGAGTAVVTMVAVLLGYVLCALGLSRGMTPRAVLARRHGLLGGAAVGTAWLVVIFPTAELKEWVLAPLMIAMLVPASIAAVAGRATHDARSGTAAAMWCGLVGGLVVFVAWMTATYLHDGGAFDPQLIRDFHASGAPNLTAYAISDNLGGALEMLVMVPLLALGAGLLGARLAANDSR